MLHQLDDSLSLQDPEHLGIGIEILNLFTKVKQRVKELWAADSCNGVGMLPLHLLYRILSPLRGEGWRRLGAHCKWKYDLIRALTFSILNFLFSPVVEDCLHSLYGRMQVLQARLIKNLPIKLTFSKKNNECGTSGMLTNLLAISAGLWNIQTSPNTSTN